MESAKEPDGRRATPAFLLTFGASLAVAAVVGVVAGFGALAFAAASRGMQAALLGPGDTFLASVEGMPAWRRALTPALGAVAAALLLATFLRGRSSLGVSGIMETVVLRRGVLRVRDTTFRVLASLGVICTGGSVGREGPIVEIGATAGSRLGSALGRPEAIPLFIACGAAGGMAAAYRAPLGAAVFVLEVMLGTFAVRRIAPVVVASVTAATVVRAVAGPDPVYWIPLARLVGWWEMSLAALLGILGGLAGAAFLRTFDLAEEAFARLPGTPGLRAGLGGLLVGLLGIRFPQVWGNGYDAVNLILAGRMGLLLMLALLVLKPVATAATVGSGGLGGVFTPTLFLGAALGGVLGDAVHGLAPGATGSPAAYAILGMAAAIGATTHAPLTAVVLLFELTLDYELLPGLMLAAVLATLVARAVYPHSHYTQRLRRHGVTLPATPAEATLLTATAASAMGTAKGRMLFVREGVAEVLLRIRTSPGDLYAVEEDGTLQGRIAVEDLAGVSEEHLASVALAEDFAVPVPGVAPGTSLAAALEVLDASGRPEIPVLESGGRIVGVLSRRSVLDRLRKDAAG